jgi:MFS family permease
MPSIPIQLRPRERKNGTLSDFAVFWTGETISLFGSQVTTLAFPLTAALTLRADATQMGVLAALQTLPAVLFGLFVGVWVDRVRRRPLLIAANVARAALIGSIPVATLFGLLSLAQLDAVAFLSGVAAVVFVVAYPALLPSLLPEDRLLEANSKLHVSSAVADIAGPGLGGFLVQLLSAPFALTVDALSFLVSVLCMVGIRAAEPPPTGGALDVRGEIAAGLRYVWRDPLVRAATAQTAAESAFSAMSGALYVLYVTRELGVGPAALGGIVAAGGPAALLGAALSGRILRRFGAGPTLVAAALLTAGMAFLVPLSGGPVPLAVSLLALARAGGGLSSAVGDVIRITLTQASPPPALRGRVNATVRVVIYGGLAAGALLGGGLGQWLGLRPALVIAAAGLLGVALWLRRSPLGAMRALPTPAGVARAEAVPAAVRERVTE